MLLKPQQLCLGARLEGTSGAQTPSLLEEADCVTQDQSWQTGAWEALRVRRRVGRRQGSEEGWQGQKPNRYALSWANWEQAVSRTPGLLSCPGGVARSSGWTRSSPEWQPSRQRLCADLQNWKRSEARDVGRLVESPGHSLVRTRQIQRPSSQLGPSYYQIKLLHNCVLRGTSCSLWRLLRAHQPQAPQCSLLDLDRL